MNQVIETIKSRRSIRRYKEEQIQQEELDIILEAGIYAATACNHQPWHFTVIQNKELIQHISNKTKEEMAKSDVEWIRRMGSKPETNVTYNAPTLIVVSGRQDAYSPLTDCSAAIQNMLVAAESLNIGSVWLGLVSYFFALEDEVKKLNIPEGYIPYYVVCLGYKGSENIQQAPERRRDIIQYIR